MENCTSLLFDIGPQRWAKVEKLNIWAFMHETRHNKQKSFLITIRQNNKRIFVQPFFASFSRREWFRNNKTRHSLQPTSKTTSPTKCHISTQQRDGISVMKTHNKRLKQTSELQNKKHVVQFSSSNISLKIKLWVFSTRSKNCSVSFKIINEWEIAKQC